MGKLGNFGPKLAEIEPLNMKLIKTRYKGPPAWNGTPSEPLVTNSANSPGKTRRFQKLKIGRCILATVLHCPIFSCFMKSTFSPSVMTETRRSDRIFGTETATDCANSADKSRKIGAKPSEQEFLVKGLYYQIFVFSLIRSISIVSASILRCSSPQNCIKLAKRTG